MATSHWLGEPPSGGQGTAALALARIAAGVARDVTVDAVVELEYAAREAEPELGGRFGTGTAGGAAAVRRRNGRSRRCRLEGVSSLGLREEDGADEPWAVLFDPARLLRGIGAVPVARRAGECVELALVPHPLCADPGDEWLPPGAGRLVVRVDADTGFLRSAELYDAHGALATARVVELDVREVRDASEGAGRVLGRMARTLVEPVELTGGVVEVEADPHDDLGFEAFEVPGGARRSWDVSVRGKELALTGDYAPERTGPVAARLAELLTPGRIVGHLSRVEAQPGGTDDSVRAVVRPMRAFPFSAWAPDEGLTCEFTVDPGTGLLVRAEARSEEGVVFRHVVTRVTAAGRERKGR